MSTSTNDQVTPSTTTPSFINIFSFPEGYSFLSISKEIKAQTLRASINAVLAFASTTIMLMAVGKNYNTDTFAAIGIGLSSYAILAVSVLTGWTSALDTFCSIEFGKDKHGLEVGIWTQIGIGTTILVTIPIAILFILFSHPIVSFVFGKSYADNGASEFLQHSIPSVLLFGIQSCFSRSLSAQHLADTPMKATIFSTAVTLLCSVLVIPNWNDAPKVVAYSIALTNLTLLVSMILLSPDGALFRKVSWNLFPKTTTVRKINKLPTSSSSSISTDSREASSSAPTELVVSSSDNSSIVSSSSSASFWTHFTKERIQEFSIVAFDSFVSVMLEWFPFEANFFWVAALTESDVATYNIYINVATLIYSVSNGISVAASSFVGKLLGEKQPILALVFGRTCVLWAIISAVFFGVLVSIFQKPIFSLYTTDPVIEEKMSSLIPFLVVHHIMDNTQYSAQSVWRGAKLQGQLPKLLIGSLWCVGMTCAWFFSQKLHWGLKGVTGGFICGFLVEIPLLIWKMNSWDWEEIAKKVADDSNEDEGSNEDDAGQQEPDEEEVEMK